MKIFLLVLAILSPLQITIAHAQVRTKTLDQRPLAQAIQAELKNRPVEAKDIQFLLNQGITEFNLGDFTLMGTKERPVNPAEMQSRAFWQDNKGRRVEMTDGKGNGVNPGRHITVEFTDPKTGKIMSFQTVFSYNKAGSPGAVYDKYVEQVTKKPNMKQLIHDLPMEAMTFYYGLGLSNLLSLMTHAEDDPKVFERYLKSLYDPVAQISFAAFIIANRTASPLMNSLLFSTIGSKVLTPKAKMRISKLLIPQLGMAVGGMASNAVHDLVNIVKSCSNMLLDPKTTQEERKAVCDRTMKDVFSADNGYRYATSAISMVTTGFIMAFGTGGLKAIGSAVSRTATMQTVRMVLSTGINLLPIPSAKLITVLKWAANSTKGAIHLVIFLKLDEWVMHPITHGVIEKYGSIGPDFNAYQLELRKRLNNTTVSKETGKITRPTTAEGQRKYEEWALEQAKNYKFTDQFNPKAGTPLPNVPTYTVTGSRYEILFGGAPQKYRELRGEEILFNWTYGWVLPDMRDNAEKSIDFLSLLEKHNEISDKWRQSLMAPMQRQFQSWLEMVAPFNAVSQMTYDFYHDFYDQAAKIHDGTNEEKFEARELLFEDNILGSIKPRDISGNIISEETMIPYVISGDPIVLSIRKNYQMNTVRQSVCWVQGLLNHNEEQGKLRRSIQTKFINDHLTNIKNAFGQYPQEIKCDGFKGILTKERPYSDFDMNKVHRGLTLLKWFMQRYAADAKVLPTASLQPHTKLRAGEATPFNRLDKIPNPEMPVSYIFTNLNYLEQISEFLGTFTPYERGELFIQEWSETFKQAQPEYFALLNMHNPGAALLQQMVCPSKQEQQYSGHGVAPVVTQNKLLGSLNFLPPPVVSDPNGKNCVGPISNMLRTDFTLYNLYPNPKLGDVIDTIITTSKPDLFGEPPSMFQNLSNKISELTGTSFLQGTAAEDMAARFKMQMQGGPNRFEAWWIANVDSQITAKFLEITDKYADGLQKNLAKIVIPYPKELSYSEIPATLTESYLVQISLYMDYVLKIYNSMHYDEEQYDLANRLKEEILELIAFELRQAIDVKVDKDVITRTHAEVLALLKKFKSLIQAPAFVSKASWTTASDEEAAGFRDTLDYSRGILSPSNPKATSMEWVNDLEVHVHGDAFTGQAFRESIEIVGKNYEKLKPVYFSEHIRASSIKPVTKLFDLIVTLSNDVYKLTQLTRLTTSSNYTEMDEKGVERRGKGSRKAF